MEKGKCNLIDRDELIDSLGTSDMEIFAKEVISDAPIVDAKTVVHATWVKHWHDTGMIGHEYEECSICGCMISDTEKFWDCSYCPRCGATIDA